MLKENIRIEKEIYENNYADSYFLDERNIQFCKKKFQFILLMPKQQYVVELMVVNMTVKTQDLTNIS